MDLASDQPVEESDSDATGNAWCTAADVQPNDGADRLPRDRMEELSFRPAALASRYLPAGVATEAILKPRQMAGPLQPVIQGPSYLIRPETRIMVQAEPPPDRTAVAKTGWCRAAGFAKKETIR